MKLIYKAEEDLVKKPTITEATTVFQIIE